MRNPGVVVAAVLLMSACGEGEPPPGARADAGADACADPALRATVERMGERLADVSLLAPDSVLAGSLREAYGALVTPELLAAWTADPRSAPGREVSSPWPERIDITGVEPADAGECRVEGEIVLVASVAGAAEPGEVAREPATLWLRERDGWRIVRWEEPAAPPGGSPPTDTGASPPSDTAADPASDAAAAAAVVRSYYADIAAGRYREAYERWAGAGAASGQTFAAFAGGFAGTATVTVDVGVPGRVEGAAGSRYVEVPVVIEAVTTGGEEQRFTGSYTLRRSVVDGASPEQRRWQLHAAEIAQVR